MILFESLVAVDLKYTEVGSFLCDCRNALVKLIIDEPEDVEELDDSIAILISSIGFYYIIYCEKNNVYTIT